MHEFEKKGVAGRASCKRMKIKRLFCGRKTGLLGWFGGEEVTVEGGKILKELEGLLLGPSKLPSKLGVNWVNGRPFCLSAGKAGQRYRTIIAEPYRLSRNYL